TKKASSFPHRSGCSPAAVEIPDSDIDDFQLSPSLSPILCQRSQTRSKSESLSSSPTLGVQTDLDNNDSSIPSFTGEGDLLQLPPAPPDLTAAITRAVKSAPRSRDP